MKRCWRCKRVRPYSEFGKNRAEKDGYSRQCRECAVTAQKARYAANRERERVKSAAFRAANPERIWARKLWGQHRMRPFEWQAMWDAQGGLCYLGQHPLPEDRRKAIVIEHDHACCPRNYSCSACRRGLACNNCNAGIGMLRDDPEFLRLVADNLERQQAITRARILAQPQAEALF